MEIDLDKIIRDKNPRLYRWLPHFVINWLKRTVHVDEINYCLRMYGNNEGVDFVRDILNHFDVKRCSSGFERLAPQGRYIFAANHPLGGFDGLVLADEIEKHCGQVKIVVNDLLMNLGPLAPLFVPVNNYGGQSVDHVAAMNEMYRSDNEILYFPAGFCSRKIDGRIQDLPWKKSFISKAIQYKRDVVPVYVDAENSRFFYNLYNFRKALGIKSSVETIYLPDEMIRQRGKTIRLTAGEPISYKTFTKERTLVQWAEYVRNLTYSLGRD